MANLVDNSGDATSNLVAGNGTNVATFTMPGNVALQVESVVATVDNAAGAATGATLEIKDQSGVVIATKRQVRTIPAGDTGTMTWALRNSGDDELSGIFYDITNEGGFLYVKADTPGGPDNVEMEFVVDDTQMILEDNQWQVLGEFADIEAGGINLDTTTFVGGVDAMTLTSSALNIVSPAGLIALSAPVAGVTIGAGDVQITIAASGTVTVNNHLGQPIFRVDEDGDLHGKTGKALVFDL